MPLKFFTEERAVVVFAYWFGNENAVPAVAQNRRCNPRRRFPQRHIKKHGVRGEIGHEGRTTGLHIGCCKVHEQSKSSSSMFTFHPNGLDCVSRPKAVILRYFATRCNTVLLFNVIRTVYCNDLDVP